MNRDLKAVVSNGGRLELLASTLRDLLVWATDGADVAVIRSDAAGPLAWPSGLVVKTVLGLHQNQMLVVTDNVVEFSAAAGMTTDATAALDVRGWPFVGVLVTTASASATPVGFAASGRFKDNARPVLVSPVSAILGGL